MSVELQALAKDDKDNDVATIEEQRKDADKGHTERDLSLRPVPAVDLAIRDVNVTLRASAAGKGLGIFSGRKQAPSEEEAPQNVDKKILNAVSADFPSGTLTGACNTSLHNRHAR